MPNCLHKEAGILSLRTLLIYICFFNIYCKSWLFSLIEVIEAALQVDKIGGQILSKLMYDWRLMDELGVLRTIYLLGSGITVLVLINKPIFIILQSSYLVFGYLTLVCNYDNRWSSSALFNCNFQQVGQRRILGWWFWAKYGVTGVVLRLKYST